MFAYLVKRLISGALVLTLVSIGDLPALLVRPLEPGTDDLRPRDQQPLR